MTNQPINLFKTLVHELSHLQESTFPKISYYKTLKNTITHHALLFEYTNHIHDFTRALKTLERAW
jgi:hypothetical protein